MEPRPTAPTTELEQESNQERLDREQRPAQPQAGEDLAARICRALAQPGAVRNEELEKAAAYAGDRAEWKRRLWRLHNEGLIKVRWVGLADPDPVEARLTAAGRDWLSRHSRAARNERE
jgi:hypothetical protein